MCLNYSLTDCRYIKKKTLSLSLSVSLLWLRLDWDFKMVRIENKSYFDCD